MVGSDATLHLDLLKYFHTSTEGGHSRVEAIMRKISIVVYWKGLKRSIKEFVRECITCQQFKYDTTAYPRLLQPLPIPKKIWTDISMDFIKVSW